LLKTAHFLHFLAFFFTKSAIIFAKTGFFVLFICFFAAFSKFYHHFWLNTVFLAETLRCSPIFLQK